MDTYKALQHFLKEKNKLNILIAERRVYNESMIMKRINPPSMKRKIKSIVFFPES